MNKMNYRWILVGIWMILIFILSHQDGTTASNVSSGFIDAVISVSYNLSPFIGELVEGVALHAPFDVIAHFILYLILGVLVIHAYSMNEVYKETYTKAFVFSFIYAVTDEIHQIFIPGRTFQLFDIFIDSIGSIVGIMLYVYIRKWISIVQKKKQSNTKNQISE